MKITISDVKAAGYCARGVRKFCERHGFDYLDFVKNGVDSEKLIGIDDAMLDNVVRGTHGREEKTNGRL